MAICPHCERSGPDILEACPSHDGFFYVDEDAFHQWSDDPLLGREVGERYIVMSVLGRGTMGRVYKAHQKRVDRVVALKVFRPEMLLSGEVGRQTTESERQRAEQRFIQEAKVLGKLTHPNCVTLFDFGTGPARDFLYMAMEFVSGVSLREAITRRPKFEAILSIALQIADALIEAHSHDIVHRDLKPGNVVLAHRRGEAEPTVKVLDFGIAKMARGGVQMSEDRGVFGTPAYMSPEQCRGSTMEVGPRSDVYALGCICFEMLCGRLPFVTDDPEEMMRLHREEPLPDIQPRQGLEVPSEFTDIVRRAMRKQPARRWQSAAAFRSAVGDVMNDHAEADDTEELSIHQVSAASNRDSGGNAGQHLEVKVPDNRLSEETRDPFAEQPLDDEAVWGQGDAPVGVEDFEAADTVIDAEAAERWANSDASDTEPFLARPTPTSDVEEEADDQGTDPAARGGMARGSDTSESELTAEFEAETTAPGTGQSERSWKQFVDDRVMWMLVLFGLLSMACAGTFIWLYLTMVTG